MRGVRPLISFVIPVRNDAERLKRCLASISGNDYPRELVEIIVVDNLSTDDSNRVGREHGAIVLKLEGTGVAALRNRGARVARGSILAFVDSDHEIDRRWIATAVDVLSSPAVAATGSAYQTDPNANWVQQQYDGLRPRSNGREEVTWLGSGNLAVRRSAFESVGGFNAELTACEDVELCNRLRLAGHRIVADPELRSVHFGDPKTLRALFLGELWRGRNNLRVTFNGPRTFRDLRSAIVPVADLLLLTAGVAALITPRPIIALMLWSLALIPAAIRAALILGNRLRTTLAAGTPPLIEVGRSAAQAMAVAVVFDAARALALVTRSSHEARRAA